VASPSKLGAAVLIAFGLPFLGAGLLFAARSVQATNQPAAARIGGAMFGSVFAIIGAGLILGALFGYARLKEQAERALANPGSPWLWRKDWAASRVETQNKSRAIGWWVAAALVNMLSLPVSLGAYSQLSQTQDPKYLVPAAFELVGLIVLFGAIRATIRLERFGKSYFEMNSLPYTPGGHVAGAIHVQIRGDAPHGIDLKLTCFRRVSTGAGDSRSTQQVPLWEDSKNIPATSFSRGPLDTVIPVDFVLPPDAFQTDRDNPNDQVYWLLSAKADVPGVDYADQFELPVYRTSQAAPRAASFASADSDSSVRFGRFSPTTTTVSETASDVAEPAQHRVILRESPDGLEFYFRAGRNAGRAALVVALTAVCGALFVAMLHVERRPPIFAFAIVGLLCFFLGLATIRTVLSSTRLLVGNGTISWRRSVFGIGSTHQVQISDVDSILPVTSLQQASSSGSTLYSLRLRKKDGKAHTLIDDIESRQEARWIVSQIEKRAGLSLNTQVEIGNSLYGPPPQPGTAATGAFTFAGARAGSAGTVTKNWPQAIGLIFFAGWVAFLGFMMLRTTAFRNAKARRAESAITAAHSVRTESMKRASLENLRAFPVQQQAEELLARSVAGDHAALQLLTQSSPGWAGHLQRTGNLGQWEDRARYSSDLRVRRAEADVELAADGWTKTPQAAAILMDQARSDPSYRGAALYYLGVLAGDGIESERSHRFVLDYARNNSDPAVRQWATEGLRFIGTDQALEELFDIFTHDASFSVRDRAGCNISDCGIFSRKQRFRMVPRLIDLVSSPHLDPRMSNWCFMALREITGENLPGDAAAWRSWYAANGSLKRAQFEALDWWQVPGDN
jgi:hypothetical protein